MSTGKPIKRQTLKIKPRDLWPSTLYLGPAVVKFLCGRRGKQVKVEYSGRGRPRHKRIQKP